MQSFVSFLLFIAIINTLNEWEENLTKIIASVIFYFMDISLVMNFFSCCGLQLLALPTALILVSTIQRLSPWYEKES